MYFIEERIHTILLDLKQYIHPERVDITSFMIFDGDTQTQYIPGTLWGGYDKTCRFQGTVSVPPEFEGRTVMFTLRTGRETGWDATNPQFILYVNGELIQGMDINHTEAILTRRARGGETFDLLLEAYGGTERAKSDFLPSVSTVDPDTQTLYYHIKVPYDVAVLLDAKDKRRIDILEHLNAALNLVDLRRPHSRDYLLSVREAIDYLENDFYNSRCGQEDIAALCVGHTHIDVAWLWTLAQTRKKTVRSFSTALTLMKQYPEYVFMSSQPQLYQFLKEEEPALFERVREMAARGRWEAEGAMWLEADCNLISGESIVRQILYGKAFFQTEFGVDSKILWLPDVFGYSAALPQILKKSGIDYFVTTKISWSEYNKLPYDTFLWRGLDGSEILTYFITTQNFNAPENQNNTTYNGNLIPNQIMGAWNRFQQKNLTNEVMVCYGYGDGGGGPTMEMLENARRMSKGIPGCPTVKTGGALDFLRRLEQKVIRHPKLPKWVGELYLEFHRGTYTSMARNKKFNRKSELLYRDAELFAVMDCALFQTPYPREPLAAGWEKILLNQFHDILPGSSIKEVYEDSDADYDSVLTNGQAVLNAAFQNIASRIQTDGKRIVLFNPLGFVRSDIVRVKRPPGFEKMIPVDENGAARVQVCKDELIFFARDIPSKGYRTYRLAEETPPCPEAAAQSEDAIFVSKRLLSNRFFDLCLDGDGNLTSLYDKRARREVLRAGERANLLLAFEDKPRRYDAWEISLYYQEKMWEIDKALSVEVLENGPVRGKVRVTRQFLESVIIQDICIYRDIDRIDFVTVIDWKERQILLKAAFPVDIHSEKATYDIQFGNVERPTHWNTSWDYARFEVCAHKWADLSEEGYGVSLLNDCKYGYDIKDGVMRLTLLKSGIAPNKDADKERHEFTYSLYAHEGGWRAASTEKHAYCLNSPLYALCTEAQDGILPAEFSLLRVDAGNVVIDTIKAAEDTDGIILRMFEAHNQRTEVSATFFRELSGVSECDLLERELSPVDFDGNTFRFTIKPYEIKTFRLK